MSDSPVDVVMCTWNSARNYFPQVLESIRKNVLVHHFIAVDNYSKDKTTELILKYFPDAKIVLTRKPLTKAIKMGLDMVDTEFLLVVQDDVVLLEKTQEKLQAYFIDPEIGAVGPEIRYSIRFLDKLSRYHSKFQPPIRYVKERAWLVCTMMRKSAISDWTPVESWRSYEDYLITKHFLKKGFKVIETSETSIIHFMNYSDSYIRILKRTFDRAALEASGARIVKARGASESIKQLDPRMIVLPFMLSEAIIFPYFFMMGMGKILGFVSPSRYQKGGSLR